ncbi:MAG: ABC transporter permease [Promethearchaeota archaeon]
MANSKKSFEYRALFQPKLWYLTIKNIKSMFRDKLQLIWIFGYPLLFMSIFALAFGGVSSRQAYKVVVINEDIEGVPYPETSPDGSASIIFIDVLDSDDLEDYVTLVEDEDYDYEEAYKLLQVEEIDAIIEIDSLFSESIYYLDESPKVDITTVPDEVTEGVVGSIVTQIVDGIIKYVNNITKTVEVDTDQITDAVELSAFDYLAPGFIIGSVLVCISQLSAHFAEEKESKTMQRLSTTPVARRDIVLSGMLSQSLVAAIQIALMLFLAIVIFGAYIHPNANLFLLFLVPMLFIFTALGFGLLLASFVKTQGTASGLAWLVILPLQFLGGIYFPIDNPILEYMPTYFASHAMRIMMLNGQTSWEALGTDILVLAGLGIFLTIIGIILFQRKSAIY